MLTVMRKVQGTGNTIGTIINVPKELSLKLARLIIDKAERGQQVTKPDLIISYIEQGIKQEEGK